MGEGRAKGERIERLFIMLTLLLPFRLAKVR